MFDTLRTNPLFKLLFDVLALEQGVTRLDLLFADQGTSMAAAAGMSAAARTADATAKAAAVASPTEAGG
jgi:hypothetical protein